MRKCLLQTDRSKNCKKGIHKETDTKTKTEGKDRTIYTHGFNQNIYTHEINHGNKRVVTQMLMLNQDNKTGGEK